MAILVGELRLGQCISNGCVHIVMGTGMYQFAEQSS